MKTLLIQSFARNQDCEKFSPLAHSIEGNSKLICLLKRSSFLDPTSCFLTVNFTPFPNFQKILDLLSVRESITFVTSRYSRVKDSRYKVYIPFIAFLFCKSTDKCLMFEITDTYLNTLCWKIPTYFFYFWATRNMRTLSGEIFALAILIF